MTAPWIEASGIIDDFSAGELYIDGYRGIAHAHGAVKINLTVDRFNPESGDLKTVVMQRLVLTLPNFLTVLESLNAFAARLEEDGLIVRPTETPNAG